MYLVISDVIGNTFSVNNDESDLRGRYDVIWQNLLLKIAMTHPLSNLKVRTLTINSGDVPPSNMFGHVPPLKHVRARTPPLRRHIGGYLSIIMLLYIAMTHAWAYPPPHYDVI